MKKEIPISDKQMRESIQSLNQVIKEVYKHYSYSDGIIIPSAMDDISNPNLFTYSLFIHDDKIDFMDGAVIEPQLLSNAMTKRCGILDIEDGKRTLINEKKQISITYGFDMDELHLKDFNHNPGLNALSDFKNKIDKYDIRWDMDDDIKDLLLSYEATKVCIGENKGKDVNLVMTKKLFPAIKKANQISVYAKLHNEEEQTYKFATISAGNGWRFYSFHRLINIA